MTFLIGGANSDSGAYQIDNSLRFNKADSAKLSFTQGTPTSRRTWTYSTWVKRGNLADQQESILSWGDEDFFDVRFQDGTPDDGLLVYISDGDSKNLATNRLFRDPAAWYHIIVASDTTDGTAGDRTRIYVNGVEETVFTDNNHYSENTDYAIGGNVEHRIGDGYGHFDGYMARYEFIDGTALTPASFGETKNGVWIAKEYTGSYGTNGHKLEFKQTGTSANSSGLGADTSGNDNHYTPTQITAIDSNMPDSPENNFATMNSLLFRVSNGTQVYSEGNLKYGAPTANSWGFGITTLNVKSGKWYAELRCAGNTSVNAGVINVGHYGYHNFVSKQNPQNEAGVWQLNMDGTATKTRFNNSHVSATYTGFGNGQILGILFSAAY